MTFRAFGVSNMLEQKRELSPHYRQDGQITRKRTRSRQVQSFVQQRSSSEIHALAMQALRHFAAHGDSIFLSKLVTSISTPAARKALIAWCQHYAGLTWKPALGRFRGGIPKKGVAIAEAEKNPFRASPTVNRSAAVGIDVSILWTVVDPLGKPCKVCRAPSMIGEDTCFAHHFK